MSQLAERLKAEALGLCDEDRAELAYCLIRSLDEGGDSCVQSAWEAELGRRWQDMESGKIAGQPAEKVFAEARKNSP